jgi:hypothetical protein
VEGRGGHALSPRLDTVAPTDRSMWRMLLKRCHPDHGGEHDLFVWLQALYEHVAGNAIEDARTSYPRRQPPPHPTTGERIDFTAAYSVAGSFDELTLRAVRIGNEAGEPYRSLLRLLEGCAYSYDIPLSRQQEQGATYRTLAAIAYAAGMTYDERGRWYEVCRRIPLSQRHASHILSQLKRAAA